jgi:tRNA nucleotidyltransferase/poly(A) polymerase
MYKFAKYENLDVYKNSLKLVQFLSNSGYDAYFVGGFVRDALLKKEVKDIDIVTNARPIQIKKVLGEMKNIKFLEIGESFNIIIAVFEGKQYEIASFRGEKEYKDGRRPSKVYYTQSLEDDAKRRDFTINALYYDPINDKIYDFFKSQKDLQNKVVRAIGKPKERFEEDYLRMLRAIRFAAQKNFDIEEKTFNAIKLNASKIILISKERIKQEFDKILLSNKAGKYIKLCIESGLFENIFLNEIKSSAILSLNKSEQLLSKYALILETHINPEVFLSNFAFDNVSKNRILWILERKDLAQKWNKISEYEKKLIVSNSNFDYLLDYLKSKNIKFDDFESFRDNFKQDEERFKQIKKFTIITGKDLIKLGIPPGKKMGKIIEEIKEKYILGE